MSAGCILFDVQASLVVFPSCQLYLVSKEIQEINKLCTAMLVAEHVIISTLACCGIQNTKFEVDCSLLLLQS